MPRNCKHEVLIPVGGGLVRLCVPELYYPIRKWPPIDPQRDRIRELLEEILGNPPIDRGEPVDLFEGVEFEGLTRGPASRDLAVIGAAFGLIAQLETSDAKAAVEDALLRVGNDLAQQVAAGARFQ